MELKTALLSRRHVAQINYRHQPPFRSCASPGVTRLASAGSHISKRCHHVRRICIHAVASAAWHSCYPRSSACAAIYNEFVIAAWRFRGGFSVFIYGYAISCFIRVDSRISLDWLMMPLETIFCDKMSITYRGYQHALINAYYLLVLMLRH